ncbi:MAG: DUF6020 family protein [Oscillospiraceae bacterium]|nr:DUF6020 family protein [Oscillospiraceae bacterium]
MKENLKNRIFNERNAGALSLSAAVLYSFLSAVLLAEDSRLEYSNSFLPLVVFFSLWALFRATMLNNYSRYLKQALPLALLLSFFCVYGREIAEFGPANLGNPGLAASSLLISYPLFLAVSFLWSRLDSRAGARGKNTCGALSRICASKHRLYIFWAVIFCAWLPALLAMWPGLFTYGTGALLGDVEQTRFNLMNPLLHSLISRALFVVGYKVFGTTSAGVTLYCIVQMLLLSGSLAYAVDFVLRRGYSGAGGAAALTVVFSLSLPLQLLSISTTKDTMFYASLLVFCLMLAELLDNPEEFLSSRGRIVRFALTGLFSMFLRKISLLLFLPILLIVALKLKKRDKAKGGRFALMSSAILIAFCIVSGPVSELLATEKTIYLPETICVPLQQLAYVYRQHEDELGESEREAILALIPPEYIELYDEDRVDVLKDHFQYYQFMTNPLEYAKLWLSLGADYPLEYLDAFLTINYKYWYPTSVINSYTTPAAYHETEGSRTEVTNYASTQNYSGIERNSLMPRLAELYDRLCNTVSFSKLPLLSAFFSPGVMLYISLFALFRLSYLRAGGITLLPLTVVVLTAGLLFGPMLLIRYALFSFMAAPVCLTFALGAPPRPRQSEETAKKAPQT